MGVRLVHVAALWLPAMGIAAGLAGGAWALHAAAEADLAKRQEVLQVERLASNFEHDLSDISADLLVLAGSHELLALTGSSSSPAASGGLLSDVVTLGLGKESIAQVLILDAGGREVARVDFVGGRPHIAPPERLRAIGDQADVQQVLALAPGQVHISALQPGGPESRPLDPLQLTLRFGTPLATHDGTTRGAVLLKAFWAPLAGHLDRAYSGRGRVILLDRQGRWLHGAPALQSPPEPSSFAAQAPGAWARIDGQPSGAFTLGDSHYSFATVTGDVEVGGSAGRVWTAVTVVPNLALASQARAGLPGVFTVGAFVAICILIGVVLLLRAWEQRREAERHVADLAYRDVVTRLPNRTSFLQLLEKQLHHVRHGDQRLGLLFVDLDDFKHVNDALGHDAGDELLRAVAARMGSSIRCWEPEPGRGDDREPDLLSRIGGDEFVVLLSRVRDAADCGRVADRIVEALGHPFQVGGARVSIGASIGIAVSPEDGLDGEDLLRSADHAMYEAKRSGKGGRRYFQEAMNDGWAAGLALERTLRSAVERDELVVHYQPKVDVATGRPTGCEALVRLQGSSRLISPDDFLPVAHRAGLLGVLSRQVLRTAMLEAKGWPDFGLPPLSVAVNMPPEELLSEGVVGWLSDLLQELDFDPTRLELEITEDQLIRHPEQAVLVLRGIEALGVRVSIDDFGTGYSSLSYLVRMPVSAIKIDRSFVAELNESPAAITMISAIIELGNRLGLHVIAEGIETEEQRATLDSLGCPEAQGYLFARPLPASEFREWARAATSSLVTGESDEERPGSEHGGRREVPSGESALRAPLGEVGARGRLPDGRWEGANPAGGAEALHAEPGHGGAGRPEPEPPPPRGGGR